MAHQVLVVLAATVQPLAFLAAALPMQAAAAELVTTSLQPLRAALVEVDRLPAVQMLALQVRQIPAAVAGLVDSLAAILLAAQAAPAL